MVIYTTTKYQELFKINFEHEEVKKKIKQRASLESNLNDQTPSTGKLGKWQRRMKLIYGKLSNTNLAKLKNVF